ncbi:hypothetical protein PSACC_02899 [Paramicrosporidium saccamoebae]|uniref:BHLH domain-containing protein n=1 Tax=Paramicrosporidium saccamoebae TaxID=1246581 RepID=A0A2H9THR1_9FUNG|nr:hypothetical protein PSACC_02899 [Paramicrosporidium saccamoebae]
MPDDGPITDLCGFNGSLLAELPTIDAPSATMPHHTAEGPRLLDLRELDYIEKFLCTLTPRLDEQERRERHVASEHKRRGKIKDELARMAELVGAGRCSQARLLGMANESIEGLRRENERLREAVRQGLLGNHKH